MRKLFKSGWLVALGLLTLSCLVSCEKEEDADNTPRVTCLAGAAGTAMRGEKVIVNVANISPTTKVTVKFGREKTLERTGSGTVSYAFTESGLKSIRVTTSPEEVQKTVWLVEVQALESIQTVAAQLKANPNLCLVMCHRCNSSDWSIAENSLTAINKCVDDKIDIVEMDVQTTKDGVLVVSHDQNVNRETNGGNKNIKDLTLAQIKSFFLKDRNSSVTSDKMLTFDEFLDACKGRIYVNVDIGDRDASVTKVVNAITRKGMIQQCLVYCNSVEKIKEAYKANPECNVYTFTNATRRDAMLSGGVAGYTYFTQCGYAPSEKTSRSGQASSESSTDPAWVAESAAKGTITTVNAIYTTDTQSFYPHTFPVSQILEIYELFPSCQCVHVDTGKEAREALVQAGKELLRK